MARRRPPAAAEWRFLMSPDDAALVRAILPADSLVNPRLPTRWKLWLSLALPPLLAAGAALYRLFFAP